MSDTPIKIDIQSVAPSSLKKTHYAALDGLRGIAAIIVVLYHYFDELHGFNMMRNPISHGFLAVDFFFCLSGFVIACAYDERMKNIGLGRFFLNRLIRLHPLVIIGSIIGAVAYAANPFLENPLAAGWKTVLWTFFLSLFLIPTPYLKYRGSALFPYNVPTWSLFFEYIINAVYAFLLCRVTRKWLVVIGALSAAFLIYIALDTGMFHGGWSRENYMHGFARVGYSFTAGLLISRFKIIWRNRLGFLLPGLLLVGVCLSPHYYGDLIMELYYVMLLFPMIVCLGAGTGASGIIERMCNLLGRISYSLYMTHMSTVILFGNYKTKVNPTNEKSIIIIISLAIFNLLFAYAITRWVDEPLRKWLNNLKR